MVNHTTTTTTRGEVKASLAEQRLHRVAANVIHTNSSVERKGRGGGNHSPSEGKGGHFSNRVCFFFVVGAVVVVSKNVLFFFSPQLCVTCAAVCAPASVAAVGGRGPVWFKHNELAQTPTWAEKKKTALIIFFFFLQSLPRCLSLNSISFVFLSLFFPTSKCL